MRREVLAKDSVAAARRVGVVHVRSVRHVAALSLCALGASCGGDDNVEVDTTDTSPPAFVAMDAHVPTGTPTTPVTVSVDSANRSVTLTTHPIITLIAGARDPESAISALQIDGETTVLCRMGDVGERKRAVWQRKAPLSGPASSPNVTLEVDTADLRRSCSQGLAFVSLEGRFSATATNGVNMARKTATFSFRRALQ